MRIPENIDHAASKLLAALPAEERRRLAPYLEAIEMPQRMLLCSAELPIAHVYFPSDAVTSTLVEMPEGDSVEVGLTGAEGIVGLDLLYGVRKSLTTVIVQVPGRGFRMNAEAFRREVLAKNSDFYDLLLRYARMFFGMVAQSGACNASHGIEQRLARWLLLVHDRVGRDRFPLTHEFTALMLGVRRASVTQTANMLRTAGAIDYQRAEIHVTDRAALERCSCACYALIRRLADSLLGEAIGGLELQDGVA